MKKALLLTSLVSLGLVGCGDSGDPGFQTPPPLKDVASGTAGPKVGPAEGSPTPVSGEAPPVVPGGGNASAVGVAAGGRTR